MKIKSSTLSRRVALGVKINIKNENLQQNKPKIMSIEKHASQKTDITVSSFYHQSLFKKHFDLKTG
jgi:hypothetical protein